MISKFHSLISRTGFGGETYACSDDLLVRAWIENLPDRITNCPTHFFRHSRDALSSRLGNGLLGASRLLCAEISQRGS